MIFKLEQQVEGDNARFTIDMTGYELHIIKQSKEARNHFFENIAQELKLT
ncbi:hypothetical protein LCGC14_0694200 [marine sediment metagenome]|uniref:Uncharacterized protein n=1 Tax=marine sediment metagenome TaxID=412755 RepID=A0A0F9TSH4_9ZZZZ